MKINIPFNENLLPKRFGKEAQIKENKVVDQSVTRGDTICMLKKDEFVSTVLSQIERR